MNFMEKLDNEKIDINVIVREEKEGNKKIFVVNNDELGIADFGDTLDNALCNFKKSAKLFLDAYPEKKQSLIVKESETPPLITRILI